MIPAPRLPSAPLTRFHTSDVVFTSCFRRKLQTWLREATRGSMLLRFGRLAVHPVVSHVNGFVKRDLGRLVILGILDVAAFDEASVRSPRPWTARTAVCARSGVRESSLLSLSTSLSALSIDCCSSFLDSSNDFVSEVPFEEVLFERGSVRLLGWVIGRLSGCRAIRIGLRILQRGFGVFLLDAFQTGVQGIRWRRPTFWLRD